MILREIKVIEIDWQGPYNIDQIREMNGESDFGLYMAYGPHRVYGEYVLLYVGKAEQQSFGRRILQHLNEDDWYGTEMIYLGRLGGNENISFQEWDEFIDYSESKFIQYCLPAWNSSKLNGNKTSSFGEAIIINNGAKLYSIPRVLADSLFLHSSFYKRNWEPYSNKKALKES